MFQTYHILFGRSTSLTSKGSCGLQSPEIKRKVVTARRGDATESTIGVKTQNRTDGKSEGTDNSTDGWERRLMTTSCELSLSVHSVFYLTRQPLHTLHKEMNIKNTYRLGVAGGKRCSESPNKSVEIHRSFCLCLVNISPPHWALLQWRRCLHRCARACPSTSPGRGSATLSRWTLRPCTPATQSLIWVELS